MEYSSYIGKRVLSPAGEDLGYVKEARVTRDCKKLSCLVCIDGEEEEFVLPARALLAAGDAVIANAARLKAPSGVRAPIGIPAYSCGGEFLGRISDLVMGDKPLFVLSKEGAKTAFAAELVAVGGSAIVYPEGKRPAKKIPQKAKKSKPQTMPAAEGCGIDPMDRLNLLGRTVRKSVFDGEGNLIAEAGERITPAVISAARRSSRLLSLTVNTLTNLY